MTVASCSQTVSGTAQRAQPDVPDPDRSYGYNHDRCGLLADDTVQQTMDADHIVRPYSGAVCQYVLTRGDGPVDVTFSWFETGSLDRERDLADERGARITDTVVERHPAFLARRDVTGAACSATAAAGPGVLSWWVQLREPAGGDPCVDAEKLLAATLQAEM
ncbi:lipoprotein [Mycolicibacterium pulveris]|uniref:Lipoprotein n=2 Tax=Mycolicibacterium pulveris TaxID=36813 RepID=A0A7I7UGM1_MYCPV|nr:lipoprotein [Mycolicibacterium pulveris]